MSTLTFGSITFRRETLRNAVETITRSARAGDAVHVHLANAYSLALADSDADYASTFKDRAINYPDGRPISLIARAVSPVPLEQVRGPALFEAVFASQNDELHHYLLGSSDETLEQLSASLKMRYPKTRIVGSFSPPYRPLTDLERSEQDARIRDSGANVVWVGLGTPKQDFEAKRISAEVGVVAVAVGAAFDFSADAIPKAPPWMQRLALEWLFRLASEPRRLWRRYLFGNTRFMVIAAKFIVAELANRSLRKGRLP